MTSSVDGLVSGLNTTQLITQLMMAESAPQARLQAKVTAKQTAITAYQSVNTKLSALQTAATALIGTTAWTGTKATASSTSVVATAAAGTTAGSLTFDVVSVSKAHMITAAVDADTPVVADNLSITDANGLETFISTLDNTPQGIADAINAENIGVRAAIVDTGSGSRLQLTATKPGSTGVFTVTGLTGDSIASAGTDAKIKIGDVNPYYVTSTTNTFNNVIPGVAVTVTKPETDVTVGVAADTGGLADRMQALADAVNAANTEVSTQTAYDAATKKVAPLGADSSIRQLRSQLLSQIGGGQGAVDAVPAQVGPPAVAEVIARPAYGSFQTLGFTTDRYGKVSFDRTKFLAAYEADPAAVQSAVSDGLATKLNAVAARATDAVGGTITASITGTKSYIDSLGDQISNWDIRLASKQAGLKQQFSRLEVALGKMKDQASWLSGQIANLPSSS
jgi:flagellar hook-associated protein 2